MGNLDFENTHSFYLFAIPSFVEGMGRVLDIGSTLDIYNDSLTPGQADYKALMSDWVMVGNDIRNSIYKYKQQLSDIPKTH